MFWILAILALPVAILFDIMKWQNCGQELKQEAKRVITSN